MGCGGSKPSKSKTQRRSTTRLPSTTSARRPSQVVVADMKPKRSKSKTDDDEVSVRDKKEFAQLVLQVITLKKGLITASDIEKYIGLHPQKSNINAFRQKNIIRKIVADEFIKGRIAIKPIKNNAD